MHRCAPKKKPVSVDLQAFTSFCFSSQRRERDSNPRYLAVQRFSRPPHSTTLPSLQSNIVFAYSACETVCFSVKAVAKLGVLLKSQNLLGKKNRQFFNVRLILLYLRILRRSFFFKNLIQFFGHGHSLFNPVGHSNAVAKISSQQEAGKMILNTFHSLYPFSG